MRSRRSLCLLSYLRLVEEVPFRPWSKEATGSAAPGEAEAGKEGSEGDRSQRAPPRSTTRRCELVVRWLPVRVPMETLQRFLA